MNNVIHSTEKFRIISCCCEQQNAASEYISIGLFEITQVNLHMKNPVKRLSKMHIYWKLIILL